MPVAVKLIESITGNKLPFMTVLRAKAVLLVLLHKYNIEF